MCDALVQNVYFVQNEHIESRSHRRKAPPMIHLSSADAQNRFGQLLEMAQREPVAITRHGRTAGFVIAPQDMEILLDARQKRSRALADLQSYVQQVQNRQAPGLEPPTAQDVADEIRAARLERHGKG